MPLVPGTQVGPYEILGLVGAGGMGEVYRARDARLRRDVAIKVLPEAVAAEPDRLRRLEREARAVASLNHPNVLTVYDVGTHDGVPYVVTELLEGATLRETLRCGHLPVDRVVDIALHIARGLASAQEKGIVHRDIKPENVFVGKDGQVKILDFGLAKQAVTGRSGSDLPTPDAGELTREGSIVGTAAYMSPEQARGEALDGRSDLFGLGIVICEMLAGRRPFERGTAVDTLHAILHEEPELPSGGGVPPTLVRIVARCLEKEPGGRFQTAKDLASALERWAQATAAESAGSRDDRSVVVLPFENLSPDPYNAYFADGLTEETIAGLSRVHALRVTSRTSAMHYKGTDMPLPLIARELNVRYVLEGSVRKAGVNLRITSQLIEAASDAHLWAETYSGTLDDVFAIQERVARSIVEALQVRLTAEEDRHLAARPLPNAAAYDCYLRAQHEIWQWTPEALARAERHLLNAVEIVGEHPVLLAGLSQVHTQAVNIGHAQDEGMKKALAYADRALALDPGSAQGHAARGQLCTLEGDYPASVRHYRLANAAAPGDSATSGWLAFVLAVVGKMAPAAAVAEECLRLDPVNPNWRLAQVVLPFFRGEFDEAASEMQRAIQMAPDWPMFLFWQGLTLAFAGRLVDSLRALTPLPSEPSGDVWTRLGQLLSAALKEQPAVFDGLLSEDFLPVVRRDGQSSWHVAGFEARLGRKEASLDWLENAVDRTFVPVALFERDPFLALVRGEPRFVRILARARRIQASVPD